MKRTKTPQFRQKINKKDVSFKIIPEEQRIAVTIKKLSKYSFKNNCKLFFEIYSRNFFYRSSLENRTVSFFVKEKERTVVEAFSLPEMQRNRLKLRLKIVHPKRSYLLGIVENIKESGIGESALPVTFKNIDSVYRINWDEGEPELIVNEDLKENFNKAKPIIAENLLRAILIHMTTKETYCSEEAEELWSGLVSRLDSSNFENLSKIKEIEDFDSKVQIIDDIVTKFSKKHNLVKQILKVIDKK